jgi:di/tricarboxylate transporter
MISFPMVLVFLVILFLLVALYSGIVRAEVAFFIAVTILTVSGILSPTEALMGFANEQLAVIMLLLVISDIIRKTDAIDLIFNRLFNGSSTVSEFVMRLVAFVAPPPHFSITHLLWR